MAAEATPAVEADGAGFRTTRWTWVEVAGGGDSERARAALAELCQAYWYPLYLFARRSGADAAGAEDAVQDFFARLIEKQDLASVTRGRGRFRSFLRAALSNHMQNLRDRESAVKRGGRAVRLSIDADAARARFEREVASDETPERAFDRAWTLELLAACLDELGAEYESAGRGEVFRELCPRLRPSGADSADGDLADAARRIGSSEGALRVALHRLRARFRERLRAAIARTVSGDAAVEDEIHALFRSLGGSG